MVALGSEIGPFSITMRVNDDVELNSDGWPEAEIARITGRYSGVAPAITALMATCLTVNVHEGCAPCAALNFPMPSSGLWLLSLSIASPLFPVGRVVGL